MPKLPLRPDPKEDKIHQHNFRIWRQFAKELREIKADLASTKSSYATRSYVAREVGDVSDGNATYPSTSTDNALVRYDGTTGKRFQDSNATVDDSGSVNIPTGQTYKINNAQHTHSADDVTSDTFADARIAESNVTQHEAALTLTESQISDLDHDADKIKGITVSIAGISNGQVIKYDSSSTKLIQTTITGTVGLPGSSTDTAAIRWDGVGGDTLDDSLMTIDDTGTVNIPSGQTYNINGTAHVHTPLDGGDSTGSTILIQIRRDTAANWTSNNPTLPIGEWAYETDTDKVKIGDGSTAWTSLGYAINMGAFVQTEANSTVHDGVVVGFGDDDDFTMSHNGTNMMTFTENTGSVTFDNDFITGEWIFKGQRTGNTEVTFFTLDPDDGADGAIEIPNSVYINMGVGGHAGLPVLQMYSDGTDAYIVNDDNGGVINLQATTSGNTTSTVMTIDRNNTRAKVADNYEFVAGSGNNIRVYHDGSDSYITNIDSNFYIGTERNASSPSDYTIAINNNCHGGIIRMTVEDDDGGTKILWFDPDVLSKGGAFFTEDDVALGVGTGIDAYMIHDNTDFTLTNTTGQMNITNTTDGSNIVISANRESAGGTKTLTLDPDLSTAGILYVDDNMRIASGASQDTQLATVGNDSYFIGQMGNTGVTYFWGQDGHLYFRCQDTANADDRHIYFHNQSSSGTLVFHAHDAVDADRDMVWNPDTGTAGGLHFEDAARIVMGDNDDAYMAHDGTDFTFTNTKGHLTITNANDAAADQKDIYINNDSEGGNIVFTATDNAGNDGTYITINPDQYSPGSVMIPDDVYFIVGDDADFFITHTGNHTYYVNETGNLTIENRSDGDNIVFETDDASNNTKTITFNPDTGTAGGLHFEDDAQIVFGTDDDAYITHDGTDMSIVSDLASGEITIQATPTGESTPDTYLTVDPDNTHVKMGGFLNLGYQGEEVISSGEITVAGSYYMIDTEGGAATDDLDTINGGSRGDILVIHTQSGSRDVYVKHGTGNIYFSDSLDKFLGGSNRALILIRKSSGWVGLSYI